MPKTWTTEEDNYLRLNCDKFEVPFLCTVLGRTQSAVEDRIRRLRKSQIEIQPELEFFLGRANSLGTELSTDIKGTVVTSQRMLVKTKKQGKGNAYQYSNTGWRADIGINARSNWESNFARVLNLHGIEWEFEPRVFTYPIKRGTKGYTPDFYLNATEEWVELKGWMDTKSQTKIKRFKRYYKDEFERMTLIISRSSKVAREFCENLEVPNVIYYEEIGKHFRDKIPTWEGK